MVNSPINSDLVGPDGTLTTYAAHMIALGRLCVSWAYMERLMNDILPTLMGCSEKQGAVIATETSTTVGRCQLLANLAYADAPSADWRDRFVDLMNYIRNDLAPPRNRYIHDYWTLSEGAMERLDQRVKIAKADSFQIKELTYNSWHTAKPGEIDDLATKVTIVILTLHFVRSDLHEWRESGRQPARPALFQWPNMKPK